MSVFTTINQQELQHFLKSYPLGALRAYEGISAGIENTNYFVTTSATALGEERFVLTIFETIDQHDLSYALDLMAFLADNGLPAAHPVADNNGNFLQQLKNKPAALVRRLPGSSMKVTDPDSCRKVAYLLGKLHLAGLKFTQKRPNPRGVLWRRELYPKIRAKMPKKDLLILNEEFNFQANYANIALPGGVIHADLFCDNILFENNDLTGIIDFYYACNDSFLLDIAIAVNDWCSHSDLSLDAEKTHVFLRAYHQVRPLQTTEKSLWPVMLRVASLRFWLSRLHDKLFPRPGELTHIKDPDEFKNKLLCRKQQQLEKLWI